MAILTIFFQRKKLGLIIAYIDAIRLSHSHARARLTLSLSRCTYAHAYTYANTGTDGVSVSKFIYYYSNQI